MSDLWLPRSVTDRIVEPALSVPGRKPVGPVKIKEAIEASSNLAAALLFRDRLNQPVNSSRLDFTTAGTGGLINVGNSGRAYQPTTSTGHTASAVTFGSQWLSAYNRIDNAPITVVQRFRCGVSSPADQLGLFCLGKYNGGDGIYAYIHDNGALRIGPKTWNSDYVSIAGTNDGIWHTLAFSIYIDSGTSYLTVYLDGALGGTSSVAGAGDVDTIGEIGRIFNGQYGDSFYGEIELTYIYYDAKPDHILKSLSVDPYQIFESAYPPILFPSTAAAPTSVLISSALIAGTGAVSGDSSISVDKAASPVGGGGAVLGDSAVSVSQDASPIAGTGEVLGQSVIDVLKVVGPIAGSGSLSGQSTISVAKSGVPITGVGALLGQGAVSVAVQAEIISGTGELLGTVSIGASGNVVVSAQPITATGTLQGQSVVSVNTSGVIAAAGSIEGQVSTGLVLTADPITGVGSLSGVPVISANVSGVIAANGDVTGQVLQNVLVAADAIVGTGNLTGTVQLLGPAVLGDVNDPQLLQVTADRWAVSVGPAYAVISVTPDKGALN